MVGFENISDALNCGLVAGPLLAMVRSTARALSVSGGASIPVCCQAVLKGHPGAVKSFVKLPYHRSYEIDSHILLKNINLLG